jgi:hypothetical protein
MDADKKEEIIDQEMATHEQEETTERDAWGFRPKSR